MRNSDIALYQAKEGGKGRFLYFAPEMDAVMQSKRVLEIDLREALDKKQLEVHFQPLVDICTGRIVACEALVRWNHKTRGYIPPIEFLPLAEETGLIVSLGNFVLLEACAEAASWTRDIRIAVNLSAAQFGSGDLVSVVAAVLAETGLPASRLDLEITQTLLTEDKDEVVKTLGALRDLGAHISLDDFGAGSSSLTDLSSFPFDKLKIDRSFVRDVTHRADSAAIVRAVIGLACALGITTTADGVESAGELDWLQAHGCREGQGPLFSKPIPSRDLGLLLGMTAGQRPDFNADKQAA
jgi:predicted signal transduction protein with EAL and GGDEF domain